LSGAWGAIRLAGAHRCEGVLGRVKGGVECNRQAGAPQAHARAQAAVHAHKVVLYPVLLCLQRARTKPHLQVAQ
jgi:hypothetical protein